MDVIWSTLSVAYTTWLGLSKICFFIYLLASNVLLILVMLLALLLPLWLFVKRKVRDSVVSVFVSKYYCFFVISSQQDPKCQWHLPIQIILSTKYLRWECTYMHLIPSIHHIFVLQLLPVSAYTGWQLIRVQKGVRVMHKISNQLSRDVAVISGSVCTDCKPKVLFVHTHSVK